MTHYLHGLHASSWIDGITPPSTKFPGWLTFTEIAGSEGGDYRRWANAGYGIIARLNHSYAPGGTIPTSDRYDAFATRCGAFVAHSQGCYIWIVGNEPNLSIERSDGIPIQPEQYAACFIRCYAAIKQQHPSDLVIPAAIGPWNTETGHWIDYWQCMLQTLPMGLPDGIAIHSYTHGHDPRLITASTTMDAPNQMWLYEFRHYRQLLEAVPDVQHDVPIFLTEFNPTNGWQNVDNGYIGEALCEIDAWNQANPRQIIRACCAFRWHDPSRPGWTIGDKAGVVTDYQRAADVGYTWETWDNGDEEEPMGFTNGSFEGTYVAHPWHDNILVAPGWHAWWSDKKWPDQDQNPERPLAAPEYKAITLLDDAARILEGTSCQCFFVFSKLMNAGVYQQVQVGAGKRVTYSQPFHAWCSQSDNPRVSDGELYLRAGIDPRGGTDWEAPGIVWGNWVRGMAEYAGTSISTVSETDDVTVWVHAWNKWALKHDDCYLDGATLEVEGEEPEPPEPPPSGVLRVELSGTVRLEMPSLVERVRALFR